MKTKEIRQKFLDFFVSKGHVLVPSSSLIPANDPTLLFTNAGMVQFKDVFLGKEQKPYKRATSVQKCLRAGGKHNDLEQVGYTSRHHTFFEMLGNFSFGDYFKKEAISYAWEFVTEVLRLPKEQLYVSIFEDDDEAFEIWHKHIKIPVEKIFRFGEKDNFWAMGDTGPCGPCSEIFIDRGQKYGCSNPSCTVGCDCDRYMEFWNLVFMQYHKDENGHLHPLPRPSIDTGAGLERLASILQRVDSNYEIDIFKDILQNISNLLSISYETVIKNPNLLVPCRVIADHARATTFLIADGVLPSNEGRGYVLRRIIRRAIRYGKKLGVQKEFLYTVCDFVIGQMSDAYPYLLDHKDVIKKCVLHEESLFLNTLETGLIYLEDEINKVLSQNKNVLSGDVAFKLYDTYGFPLDLTELICKEKNIVVDRIKFDELMHEQQQRSKKACKIEAQNEFNEVYNCIKDQVLQQGINVKFVGYEKLKEESRCSIVVKSQDNVAYVIFDSTPFYAESGGQVADTGKIYLADNSFEAQVEDVKKTASNIILIKIKIIKGDIKENIKYIQEVTSEKRIFTAKNHTATHLLQWALRQTLGSHIKQAGSFVTDEYLRFDFTHFQKLTEEELNSIEILVNEKIWQAIPVTFEYMQKEDALKKGALAFFDEKYEDIVRVVNIGDFSIEFCGGTHVNNTSEIHLFKITSESSIASGVRRITAVTSKNAFYYLKEKSHIADSVRNFLKANTNEEIITKLQKLENQEKELRKELSKYQAMLEEQQINKLILNAQILKDDVKLIVTNIDYDSKEISKLRDMALSITKKSPNTICVLTMKNPSSNKVFCAVGVGAKISSKISASQILKSLCSYIDGKGGGKDDLAQGSGNNVNGIEKILKETKNIILQQF